MIETMRLEGHSALVHTAAASNLGQMLNKICNEDGIGLVNIVRSSEQAKLLKGIGAKHVVDSSAASFTDDLTQALVETGATIAFDAIGGGLGIWLTGYLYDRTGSYQSAFIVVAVLIALALGAATQVRSYVR